MTCVPWSSFAACNTFNAYRSTTSPPFMSFAPEPRPSAARPTRMGDLTPTSPESIALSKDLKRRGWRFVGPTTVYAFMQSMGMVDDHLAACWRSEA